MRRVGGEGVCRPDYTASVNYEVTRAVLEAIERQGVRYAVSVPPEGTFRLDC